jgi:hypothetical protein
MPSFRIHRLKEHLRQNFRSAPHVPGTASVKPRDYEVVEEEAAQEVVEASSPYSAFFALREAAKPIQVGDLLESADGSLRIFKFVGIEDAQWVLPEVKPEIVHEAGQEVSASA